MTVGRGSTRHLLRETLLNVGAALGVLCLLAAVAAIGFGVRPLVFRSGSMGPEIATGALGLARTVPAADLAVGDVVSVVNARGVRVTHRIQTVRYANPTATLTLRGDANPTADPEPYVVTEADRLFWSVNHLGYAVSALSSPWGTFGAGLLAGGLLTYVFGRRSSTREEPADTPGRSGLPVAIVAVLAAGALLARPAALDTQAAFTDSATAQTGTFSAVQLTAPVLSCDLRTSTDLWVKWTAVPGATAYAVRVTRNLVSTTTTVVSAPTTTLRLPPTALEVGTVTVQATFAPWASASSNAVNYSFAITLVATCSP
jgi:signal peptidase I